MTSPIVSVIISNRNDLTMLNVTIRSCIEELREVSGEIVIVDNSDPEIQAKLGSYVPKGYLQDKTIRMYMQDFPCLFKARETAAEKAKGKYIFCLDSHMLVGHNTIRDLVNFAEAFKDKPRMGFLHAPISWAHQHESHAKHDRDMSVCELGDWKTSYKQPRKITWKGMPWLCSRDWFLDRQKGLNAYGALAENHISWGGGDMHIGIKPWLLGFQNWAVPTRPCIHIGPFPNIDNSLDPHKYRLYSTSGKCPHTFGFLVSCYILGGEPMMYRNKRTLSAKFGKYLNIDKWWNRAKELGEKEKQWLDRHKVISFEELLESKPWI